MRIPCKVTVDDKGVKLAPFVLGVGIYYDMFQKATMRETNLLAIGESTERLFYNIIQLKLSCEKYLQEHVMSTFWFPFSGLKTELA